MNEEKSKCQNFDKSTHLEALLEQKKTLVADVTYLAQTMQYKVFQEFTCQRAILFHTDYVEPSWKAYMALAEDESSTYE